MEKKLQMAKDFILFSILINKRREFVVSSYYKSDFSKEVLDMAIEELKNDDVIIVQKLSNNKIIITPKNDKINDCTILENSLKEKLKNYNKLKAIKIKNKNLRPVCRLNTNA